MRLPSRSGLVERARRRSGRLLATAAVVLAGCRGPGAPLPPSLDGDVAVGGGLAFGPRYGATVGASQRFVETDAYDLHVEIELSAQDLEPTTFEGERVDGTWSQVRGGFKLVGPEDDGWAWTGRAGVTWVRPKGDPVYVDVPEDFGGFYLSVGRDKLLSPRLLLSPDLALVGLFEESSGDTGLGLQLTLRLLWLP